MKNIIKANTQSFFVIIFATVIIYIHIRLYKYGFDDAYIHFRVARNLLTIGTPFYNLGEAVKVSTSSGWIILLTFVFYFVQLFQAQTIIPLIISIINAILTFTGMIVYTKIIRFLIQGRKTPLIEIMFQIIYVALIAPSSIGLMETPLAMLLAGLGIYLLLLSKREAFILLGCASYIRIELIVLIFLGGLLVVLQRNICAKDAIIFTTIGLSPFLIFDLYFYHTPLPHSITAKSILYSISSAGTLGKIIFFSIPSSSLINDNLAAFIISLGFYIGVFYVSIKTAAREWFSDKSLCILLFIFWSLFIISLYTWNHALVFEWYMPLYTIPLSIVLVTTVGIVTAPQRALPNVLLTYLFLICCTSLGQTLHASFNSPSMFSLFESGSRVKTYRQVASILNLDYPQTTLLSSEIGGLGYEFTGSILDAAGLASPDALKYHPLRIPEERESGDLGAIPPEFVEENMPELIVSYDVFAMALLNSAVAQKYNILTIPAYLPEDAVFSNTGEIWGSKFLRIYIRKDLTVSKKIMELEGN